jgi:hypothetical protein
MTKDVRISPVRPELVDIVWPAASKMLELATDTSGGKFSIEGVHKAVINGELVLWMILEDGAPVAFYTTRLVEYPNRRAMAMDWVGGSGLSSWRNEALDAMEKHARANKCQHLEGFGRAAWGRILKRRGWKPEYVAYRMELNDE